MSCVTNPDPALDLLPRRVLVKAYVEEHRSAEVRELIREAASDGRATRTYVSRLAFPEATSAFTRLRNEGKLSSADAELRFRMLESDFTSEAPSYELIDPSAAVIIGSGAQLVRKHGLRLSMLYTSRLRFSSTT